MAWVGVGSNIPTSLDKIDGYCLGQFFALYFIQKYDNQEESFQRGNAFTAFTSLLSVWKLQYREFAETQLPFLRK